jgi:hypothetical protein
LTTIAYQDLLVDNKQLQNIRVLCPFCKNKNFRVWNAIFENPKLKTNGYKAMISLVGLYQTDHGNINCKTTTIKPKGKKLHRDIHQILKMDMCCNSCKRVSRLNIYDYNFSNCIYLSWRDPRQKLITSCSQIDDVKVIKEQTKKRRAIPLGIRYQVLTRDKSTCQCCGAKASDGVQLHVDHIKPVSRGGTNIFENLQTLCKDCNLGKRDIY